MKLSERTVAQSNLIGGRLCLDFVNTVGGWQPAPADKKKDAPTPRADKLVDYADLLAWSLHVHLLTAAEAQALERAAKVSGNEAAAVLHRALALRAAIHRLCRAVIHGQTAPESELVCLNHELGIAHGRVRLAAGKANFVWEWTDTRHALDQMLWRIADSAAELLTTGDLSRLRECGGEDCGWLFEDTSKNGRRQWCDMQTCGNLAKVRRFRERLQS